MTERAVQIEPHHLRELWRVLESFNGRFDRAAVFGSRATGRARRNSDIDLVLYGVRDELVLPDLDIELEDSSLPMTVDVAAYEEIASDLLKSHIDRFALPLPEPDGAARAA